MIDLLARVGGVLLAPRRLFHHLSAGTGRHDGAVLFCAYLLAVALPGGSAALADLLALGLLAGLSGLAQALLPVLPWLLTLSAVEWRLGDARTHRAGLCLVPLLALAALAHLAELRGLALPGPSYLPPLLGGLASLALASLARSAIPPTPDLSPKPSAAPPDLSPKPSAPPPPDLSPKPSTPAPPDLSPKPSSRPAALLGLALAALTATTASLDLTRIARSWSTLAPVAAGTDMPEFTLPLLDGGALTRADLTGAPHLLIFWTTWCGVCEAEMPMYTALAARHPALRVIAVNADRDGDVPALARAYRDAHDLRLPIALDRGPLARDLRVRMYPHLLLVGADGRIAAVFRGRTFERSLESAIAALTAAGG